MCYIVIYMIHVTVLSMITSSTMIDKYYKYIVKTYEHINLSHCLLCVIESEINTCKNIHLSDSLGRIVLLNK